MTNKLPVIKEAPQAASLLASRRYMKPAILTMFASLLFGCSSVPYAIIDGSRASKTDNLSYNVIVTGVDGKLTFFDEPTKNIKPGTHTIRVTTTKPGKPTMKDSKTWLLDAKPCKRYVVAAKHDENKRFSNKYWELDLIRVEDIGGCKVPEPEKEDVKA
jgi:hypothetical protein